MLFDFATIISYVSQFSPLKRGPHLHGNSCWVGPVQTGDVLIGFIGNEKCSMLKLSKLTLFLFSFILGLNNAGFAQLIQKGTSNPQ